MNKKDILKFFDNSPIVILATVDGDAPHVRAVVNPRNENIAPNLRDWFADNDRLLFFTNTHSDKIAQIRKNGAAALYAYDAAFSGIELTGDCLEITDESQRKLIWDKCIANGQFAVCYPEGYGDFSLIEFIPKKFKSYIGAKLEKSSGEVK